MALRILLLTNHGMSENTQYADVYWEQSYEDLFGATLTFMVASISLAGAADTCVVMSK